MIGGERERETEIQSNRMRSNFSSTVERTHARLVVIRMQDVFMYTYVRDISNARKYYQTAAGSLLLLRWILLWILVHLVELYRRLVFLTLY